MAPRIKSVETKEALNVSQGYSTSPAREIPDSQGGNTQAAAGALVGAAETQVVPDSYEHAANPLGAKTQQIEEDFDELYDATPRKSSQKVPLKPEHLPEVEHAPLQLEANSAPALAQRALFNGHAASSSQQPGYTSSGRSKSSNCFTSVESATSNTEIMTSAAKPGKLSKARPLAGGATEKLHKRKGQLPEAEDVGAAIAQSPKKRSADTQTAGKTRTQKPKDSKSAAATKRTKAVPADNADRTTRGQKRTRAAEIGDSDYVPSQPARKKVTRASKAADVDREDEEPDSSQPPTKRHRVSAGERASKAANVTRGDEEPHSSQPPTEGHRVNAAEPVHVMSSDGNTSSPMPDDMPEAQKAKQPPKATSKAVPPRTPAQVRSSPPQALHEQVDDTVLFEQAARSSKKPNMVGWGKSGPRNQGVLYTSTPGPNHTHSAAPAVRTDKHSKAQGIVTSFSSKQRAVKDPRPPKSSNVARDVSEAMHELYRKPEAAQDDNDFPSIDEQDDLTAPKPSPPATLVTPAPQEQPSACAQPPPKQETAKPSRYTMQSVQTVDKVGSPVPQGMGIEDPTRTVLETFSQQEAGDPSEHDSIALHVRQPKQDRVMSSNTKAIPASPTADSTALTTMRATKSQSKKMLAKDDHAFKLDDPFFGNGAPPALKPKSTTMSVVGNEAITQDRGRGHVSHSAALPSERPGVKANTAEAQVAKQKPVPKAAAPALPVAAAGVKKLPVVTAVIVPAESSPDIRPVIPTAFEGPPQKKAPKGKPRVQQKLSSESSYEHGPDVHTAHHSSATPVMDEEEHDPEKTLVDSDSTDVDMNQWTATLKPHQLSLFESMVDCVQRLTEYMFDQEKGSEQMVQEHHRRTMFLIEQEEMHRAKDHARLRRIVRARKQERIADAKHYHRELVTQAAELEREKKQLRKRVAAWDAAFQDLEAFIVQYS